MTSLMTDTAFEQGRRIADNPKDKADLSILVSGVEAASGPADLFRVLPGTIHLTHRRDTDVFVVQQGRLLAVVMVTRRYLARWSSGAFTVTNMRTMRRSRSWQRPRRPGAGKLTRRRTA